MKMIYKSSLPALLIIVWVVSAFAAENLPGIEMSSRYSSEPYFKSTFYKKDVYLGENPEEGDAVFVPETTKNIDAPSHDFPNSSEFKEGLLGASGLVCDNNIHQAFDGGLLRVDSRKEKGLGVSKGLAIYGPFKFVAHQLRVDSNGGGRIDANDATSHMDWGADVDFENDSHRDVAILDASGFQIEFSDEGSSVEPKETALGVFFRARLSPGFS